MIFVTLGTDEHDFKRLAEKMDEIAGETGEKVVIQLGYTRFRPKNCEWFSFATSKRIRNLFEKSDVIVTHAGAGSIIKSLKYGKTPVIVPRMKRFGEHINDHQVDLADFLERKKIAVVVSDVKDLKRMISKVGKIRKRRVKKEIVESIKNFIEVVR